MAEPVTQEQVDAAWAQAKAAEPQWPDAFDWSQYDELAEYATQLEIAMRLARVGRVVHRMFGTNQSHPLIDQIDEDLKEVESLVDNMCR